MFGIFLAGHFLATNSGFNIDPPQKSETLLLFDKISPLNLSRVPEAWMDFEVTEQVLES